MGSKVACTADGLQVHETMRYLLAKLMFGCDLQPLVNLLTGRPPAGGVLPADASSFALWIGKWLDRVHHQVHCALKFSGKVMKSGYDVRASHVNFREGDQV